MRPAKKLSKGCLTLGCQPTSRLERKTVAVETLAAETDQLQESIARLADEISDLRQAVAVPDTAMAKQTAL